jgi:hypothetical protein
MSFGPLHLIMTMMPAVVHTGNGLYTTHGTRAIGMQRATQDGADTGGRGYNPYSHTELTALQEVKIVTTNASAEYDAPMVSHAITRSGANRLHGGYIMEFRNEALNALGPQGGSRPPGAPFLTYEGYGSGPVVIPKLYDGRNKTFWFLDIAKAKKASFSLVLPGENSRRLINPSFPKNVPIMTAAEAGFPSHLLNSYKQGWQPRVGLAYRPFGNKTVFRLGYGLFSTQGDQVIPLLTGGPFALTESFTNNIVNGVPDFQWPNEFPSAAFVPPSQSVNGVNANQRDGSYQQWNGSIEREIHKTALRISYIGSKSTHLLYTPDINKPQPGAIPFAQSRRPYPVYRSISYTDNGGNVTYHGFEIEAKQRLANGLTFDLGYDYQKTLEDVHSDGGRFNTATENPYDRSGEKEPANGVPMPHHFSANWVYELPLGRGKPFLSSGPGVVNQVFGDG